MVKSLFFGNLPAPPPSSHPLCHDDRGEGGDGGNGGDGTDEGRIFGQNNFVQEMVWRFDLADLCRPICSCFSCHSIWDELSCTSVLFLRNVTIILKVFYFFFFVHLLLNAWNISLSDWFQYLIPCSVSVSRFYFQDKENGVAESLALKVFNSMHEIFPFTKPIFEVSWSLALKVIEG